MTPLTPVMRALRDALPDAIDLQSGLNEDDLRKGVRAVLLAVRDEAAEFAGDAYRTIVYMKGESETLIAQAVFEKMIDAMLTENGQ